METGVIISLEAAKKSLGLSSLEDSLSSGMNFVNSGPLGSGLALEPNNITLGAVAGASASSTGGIDIVMFATLGVFLLCSLYLLLNERVLRR